MQLFLLICGVVLFPQACCLECVQCRSRTGEDMCEGKETTCSGNRTRCGVLRVIIYDLEHVKIMDEMTRSCFEDSDCRNFSVKDGSGTQFITSTCCDADNCLSDRPPLPPLQPLNGKKCPLCDFEKNCSASVDCVGDQNYCITTESLMGCATESICDGPPSIMNVPFKVECVSSGSSAAPVLL